MREEVPMIPRWSRHALCLTLLGILTGCGNNDGPTAEPAIGLASEKKPEDPSPQTPQPAGYERLHQPIAQATRKDPPRDWQPPVRTIAGKSVGKLYSDAVQHWDTIKFMKPDGTRIHYSAAIETDLGNIVLKLDADRAPNHVRSFIALARGGYYDGLLFDTIHQERTETGARYEEIEAGCPVGTADPGANSIGYWLEPEITSGIGHEEGTVGAYRGKEKNSAACKFYISLCQAPYLDGQYTIFGKATSGLDVARKIFGQPVVLEEPDPEGVGRPVKPIVMRKVTIEAHEGSILPGGPEKVR
jgi:cyclophilin family peptidyl-prolyl cis-trans isomerase